MQTFGKPDCTLYSLIAYSILRGDGLDGSDGQTFHNNSFCLGCEVTIDYNYFLTVKLEC